MKVVEFSQAEIIGRLWIMDVLLISKKIIEEGSCIGLTEKKQNMLLKRTNRWVEVMFDTFGKTSFNIYQINAYSLIRDNGLLKEGVNYLYSDIHFEKNITLQEMYGYIEQIEKGEEFKKISRLYYTDNGQIEEDFCEVEAVIDNFYDEEYYGYSVFNGNAKGEENIDLCYGESFYMYSIKDETILKYFKMIRGDREKEIIVKSVIADIVSMLDVGSKVIGYKSMDKEIKVIVVVNDYMFDESDVVELFQIKTETVIRSIISKHYMENEIRLIREQ